MNENTENKLKTKITDSIKKTSKYIETLNEDLTEKKKYSDYKIEKIRELEMESKKLIESCDYEKAIIILKKLIFFDSEKPEYYTLMAKLHVKLHDVSSAIACYKKSHSLQSRNVTTLRKLETLLFAKGIINLEDGKINIEILKQIKEEMNKYGFSAIAFLTVGKEQKAIKDLQKILSIDINHVEANLLLGKIYLNDGKYRDSSTYLWKVSSINPNHCEIQQYISVMKMKMKECLEKANQNVIKRKPDMGLLWTSKALSMYPCHPEALMLRSAINKTLGRFKESLEDLNNAYLNRNIDNNSAKVLEQISLTYNDLSLYLLKNKNLGEADKILDEALKFNNQDLNTHLNKGNCMMLKKDINKALEEFLFCLQLNPKCLQAKSQCALIYYKFAIMSFNNRDYQNTINNIERAMSYYQNSAEFYMLRARCYLKMSLLTKASNDINTAYLLNPNNKEINEFKKYFAELQ